MGIHLRSDGTQYRFSQPPKTGERRGVGPRALCDRRGGRDGGHDGRQRHVTDQHEGYLLRTDAMAGKSGKSGKSRSKTRTARADRTDVGCRARRCPLCRTRR